MSSSDTHTRLSATDRDLLAFIAAHTLVLASHVQALLNISEHAARERLGALEGRRLIREEHAILRAPGYYKITHIGLGVIGSDLPPPRLRLDRCRHDLGVAWAWLAARRGVFGRPEQILSNREQRARDRRPASASHTDQGGDPPLGVRVRASGEGNGLHYPDVLLIGRRGERVPVELITTSNGQRQLEAIMASYGADANIAAVLYLTEIAAIRRAIMDTAARLGLSDLVRAKPVAVPGPRPPTTR